MAEIQTTGRGDPQVSGKVRSRKMSTRVDLTPMVDLGFLLITFFMLTTVLVKPQIMPVVMPDKDPIVNPEPIKQSQVITLLLGPHDKVYWYEGLEDAVLDSTNYSSNGLRTVLLDKKSRVQRESADEMREAGRTQPISKLYVIIKPTRQSRYKNVVDAFDEMKICGISRYVLLDASPQELDFIRNPAAGLHFSIAEQVAAATDHSRF